MEMLWGNLSLNHVISHVGDMIFVNGLPFIVTMSREIQLVPVECIPLYTAKELAISLIKVIQIYARVGFNVGTSLWTMNLRN